MDGDEGSVVLDAALDLANTQLLAQNGDEASLDGQVMGLLAFDATLMAANLGAEEVLGKWWFLPLIAIATSMLVCLKLTRVLGGDFGPAAARFYSRYGEGPPHPAREQLLAELDRTFRRNARRIDAKHRGVKVALGVLLLGLLATGSLVASAPIVRI